MKSKTLLALYLGFFTIGIISNMAGPLVPYLEKVFHFDEAQAGLLISANFIGIIFSVILGSFAADKMGKRNFIISGSFLIIITMTAAIITDRFYLLVISLLLCGIGFGIYEIGINSYSIELFKKNNVNSESSLNIVHFFFGAGAIVAPLIIDYTYDLTGYRTVFFIVIFMSAVCGILMFFSEKVQKTDIDNPVKVWIDNILKNRFLWITGFTLMIYVGIEVTSYGWLPKYWDYRYDAGFISPALTSSIFWGALTLGRLLTAFCMRLMSLKRYLTVSSFLLLLTMSVWIFLKKPVFNIAVIIFIGLFLSGIFPALMNVALKGREQISGTITSFMVIYSSLGGGIIPWMSGYVIKYSSMNVLPVLLVIFSAMMFLMMFVVLRMYENKTA